MDDVPESLPDFSGKLVLVMFPRGGDDGQLISEARFRRMGGRMFLVGVIPARAIAGFGECEVAVAWDQVEQYAVLDSVDEYRKRTKVLERTMRRWKWGRKISWLYGE